MGGSGSDERITAARNKRMEEKSWKQERMEAPLEGGQGPERAVAPYMDGWSSLVVFVLPWNSTDHSLTSKPLRKT
jgi:hypothetical protein